MEVIQEVQRTHRQKIRLIRKLCGVTTHLTWPQLCKLTEFDSFATAFAFGMGWDQDRLVAMEESVINMILFNVILFPKK